MSPLFAYSPLTGKDHFRVFLLMPAKDRDANLIGLLRHTTLRDQYEELIRPYTALSYVWGDPAPVDKISLDGQELGITENLAAALRDIRDATRVHCVWADAICIDQSNICERNQQVAIIGQIYSCANNTIIYLGPLESHSEFVLREVQEAVHQDSYTTNITDATPLKMPRDASYGVETIISEAEKGLLFRPWFRRIWVLQELVLSEKPWVQCGTKQVRWRDLCRLLIPLLESRRPKIEVGSKVNSGPIYDIESMNSIRADYSMYRLARASHSLIDPSSSDETQIDEKLREGCSFEKTLKMRTGCHASDSRDAVFAYLSIISDKDEILKFVKLDYNQTIKELFTAAARYITEQGELKHLTEAITSSHPLRSILPSWVPDWQVHVSKETLCKEMKAISATTFHYSKFIGLFGVNESWKILHVSGVLPLPSAYPSAFHHSCQWDHHPDDYRHLPIMENIARKVWENFLNLGAAAGNEEITCRLASLQSWPDELRRALDSRGHRGRSIWKDIIETLVLYLRSAQPGSHQLALLSSGNLGLVPHEASAGDLVATLIPVPDILGIPGGKYRGTHRVIAQLYPFPDADKFERDKSWFKYNIAPGLSAADFKFHYGLLVASSHGSGSDEWRTNISSLYKDKKFIAMGKDQGIYDYRHSVTMMVLH
ncbi:hypothetical protein GQX73_g516 [Xylaria multiplex]|uniref:Heterokaryon incompatibility domain-containing protein n=1 Tax=Xylaria multiplex TaxID=323545 RepID=A0A7C8N0S2_9PEZI|nr:hypothetical protein GQX73_g516 [Xylaria multiplex]